MPPVAVPLKPKSIVTADSAAADNVAVTVATPPASAIWPLSTASETVGATPVIVITPSTSSVVSFVTAGIRTRLLSFSSNNSVNAPPAFAARFTMVSPPAAAAFTVKLRLTKDSTNWPATGADVKATITIRPGVLRFSTNVHPGCAVKKLPVVTGSAVSTAAS